MKFRYAIGEAVLSDHHFDWEIKDPLVFTFIVKNPRFQSKFH
jgi:hypothetical protein